MRIAAIADIHANLVALEAVLADMRAFRPDLILVAGDISSRYPWPRQTWELLSSVDHLLVSGNSETYLTTFDTPRWPEHLPAMSEDIRRYVLWIKTQLGDRWLNYIETLPDTLAIPGTDICMTHGIPGNPFLGIAPRGNQDSWPALRTDEEIEHGLAGLEAGLVICGHTHFAMLRHQREMLIVNPGPVCSVHDLQRSRFAEGAQYAIVDWHSRGQPWLVEFRFIPFDVERVIAATRELAQSGPAPWFWQRQAGGLAREGMPKGELAPRGTYRIMANDDYDETIF